ncbi:MAG: hypothetical protein ACP5GD_02790 [Candidatus Micrarchaeia archaeon]|jgi:small subunit ribosomal protein S3Ae
MTTQKGLEKWKSKQWFDVQTPAVLGSEVIGSVPAADEKAVTGRIMKVSLAWVTHDPSHSFYTTGLRIINAANGKADTEVAYLESQFSYLRSLVKRHSDAVYTYDKLKSKDGSDVVVKLLITTRNKVPYSKTHAIRLAVSNLLKEHFAKHTKDEIIKGLLNGEIRKEAIEILNKIAPISKFEIKRVEFSRKIV